MGRRKKIQTEKNTETLLCKQEGGGDEIGTKEKKGFFACYLLTSLCPRFKDQTYIGFTVNPRRRIRQHNGEMRCGALKTKTMRPWEMVLCIHGFPTNVSALQFEWAWQHPIRSLAVRKAAASFKALSGIANNIKLAYTMLTLPAWQSLNLTINFFSTMYIKHSSGCPSLPEQMKVQVRPMDELPCYMEGEDFCLYDDNESNWDDDDDECNEVKSADGFMKEGLANVALENFADCHDSIEMPSREQDGWMEEDGMRQPWDSPTSKEDHRHPSQLIDSPLKNSASLASSSTEETAKDWGFIEESIIDLDSPIRKISPTISDDFKDQVVVNAKETAKDWGFIEESIIDLDSPIRKISPTISDDFKDQVAVNAEETTKGDVFRSPLIKVDDQGQPAIKFSASCEIEVIDVFTPSPDCKISLWGKKRRVSMACPEIIDLTKSPAFVQL